MTEPENRSNRRRDLGLADGAQARPAGAPLVVAPPDTPHFPHNTVNTRFNLVADLATRLDLIPADSDEHFKYLLFNNYLNSTSVMREILPISGTDPENRRDVIRRRQYGALATAAHRTINEVALETRGATDSLTGVWNRGAIDNVIENLRRNDPDNTGLLFIDIDHFKKINDTLGHRGGDEVLINLINNLRAAIRNTDQIGRYGGEEFVIVFPNMESEVNLAKKAIELKKLIEEQMDITISMGLTMMHSDDDSKQSIYNRADAALYAAKGIDNGARNKSVIFLGDGIFKDISTGQYHAAEPGISPDEPLHYSQVELRPEEKINLAYGSSIDDQTSSDELFTFFMSIAQGTRKPKTELIDVPLSELIPVSLPPEQQEQIVHTAIEFHREIMGTKRGSSPIEQSIFENALRLLSSYPTISTARMHTRLARAIIAGDFIKNEGDLEKLFYENEIFESIQRNIEKNLIRQDENIVGVHDAEAARIYLGQIYIFRTLQDVLTAGLAWTNDEPRNQTEKVANIIDLLENVESYFQSR